MDTPLPPASGYSASPSTGQVTVPGDSTVSIQFAVSGIYRVTFEESGLYHGTTWSVTLAGQIESSAGTSISFSVRGGLYSYSVDPPQDYSASPSSAQIPVPGVSTIDISFTLINWQGDPAFSVSSISVQMGKVNILGYEYTWNQGLANNPTQFFIVSESPGYSQSDFDQALSQYLGISVPSSYEPKLVLIMILPLISDLNSIGGTYSLKTYEADFNDILPSSVFDGHSYLETTPQGDLQLAMTLSASTNYVGITDSLLNLIESIAGITIDDFSPVAKAPSNQILNTLVDALELITASCDITVTDITEPLMSDGQLSSYTFLDLYTLSNVLSSSIHVGKLFKTFLDVIYFGQKFVDSGLISSLTLGIALIDDAAAISSLVQLSFSSASLAAQLFSYIFPEYNSNTLLSAIESGVENIAGFIDPNGTTIQPSLIINQNTIIGFDPQNRTFVTNISGNYALYIGDSYYFFTQSGTGVNEELRMNVVNGTSTVPYYVDTISMNASGNLSTIAGEAVDGSTPVIDMTISPNGSISSGTYISPEITVKPVRLAPFLTSEAAQSNPYLLNVSVTTYLSDGVPVNVDGVTIVSSGETIQMYSINGSSFYYVGTFESDASYSVYVKSTTYPGGYGTFTTTSSALGTTASSLYLLSFEENGLKKGQEWGISLSGDTVLSTNGTVLFYASNGSYKFQSIDVSGYTVSPLAGNVPINGHNHTVQVTYALNASPGTSTINKSYDYIFVAVLVGIVVVLAAIMNRRRYR